MNIICKSGFTWLQKNMGKITTSSKVVTFPTNPDMIHYSICMQIRPERCFLTHHNLFAWKQTPPGLTGSLTSLPRFPPSADRECSMGALYQPQPCLPITCLSILVALIPRGGGFQLTEREERQLTISLLWFLTSSFAASSCTKRTKQIVGPLVKAIFPPKGTDNLQRGE